MSEPQNVASIVATAIAGARSRIEYAAEGQVGGEDGAAEGHVRDGAPESVGDDRTLDAAGQRRAWLMRTRSWKARFQRVCPAWSVSRPLTPGSSTPPSLEKARRTRKMVQLPIENR